MLLCESYYVNTQQKFLAVLSSHAFLLRLFSACKRIKFSQVCVGISLGFLFKTQLEQVLLHRITVFKKVKDST